MVTSGVLQGIRVVDFGQYISGPMAAMQLADHGAEVIRIDPIGGPVWPTPANSIWNRGKKSICLDLKLPSDQQIARELINRADIVIENFRPHVMRRLGLDPKDLLKENPHLIWCSLPGFASDDPRGGLPAWEGILGAVSGNFLLKPQRLRTDGGRRQMPTDDGRPIYSMTPVASVFGACMAAMSITMALVARQRDGRGQHIQIPLQDALLAALGSPRWKGLPGTPWVRSYPCADGRWVDLLCYHGKHVRAFTKAAGVDDWLGKAFMNDIEKVFRTDPQKSSELIERMEALFLTRPASEWEEILAEGGVPLAMVRTSAEWLHHPEAQASGCITKIDDPNLGPVLQPGIQVHLTQTPGYLRGPAPRPDQHREEILAELRQLPVLSLPLVEQPDNRPPLAGLKMVDLGSILVGPACGRTLAEYGVDVIKVDDPHGAGVNPDVNRGKRSIYLDLRKPQSCLVLDKLLQQSDLILENFRHGVAKRHGFDFSALHKKYPQLIGVSFTLYGQNGSWAGRPGYENQAQAATGMMERFGDGIPAVEPCPVNDYCTALTGTFGVALAIFHRNRYDRKSDAPLGQHVSTGLVFTASLLQSMVMYDYAGKAWDDPRGQDCLGSSAQHRCYQAADDWFFLAMPSKSLSDLTVLADFKALRGLEVSKAEAKLEAIFISKNVDDWAERLGHFDIAVQRVAKVGELMAAPRASELGLVLDRAHPDGGREVTIGPIAAFSRTKLRAGQPVRPSQDGPDILCEIGLADRAAELIASGTVPVLNLTSG